jgi:hypothetical protein
MFRRNYFHSEHQEPHTRDMSSRPGKPESSAKLLWKPQNLTFSTLIRKLVASLVTDVSLYPVGTCRDVQTRAPATFTKMFVLINDKMLLQIQIFEGVYVCVPVRVEREYPACSLVQLQMILTVVYGRSCDCNIRHCVLSEPKNLSVFQGLHLLPYSGGRGKGGGDYEDQARSCL